jgi:Ca2+-binding RTX toxin-like protein
MPEPPPATAKRFSPILFCCDQGSDEMDTSGATTVWIWSYEGDDDICLLDDDKEHCADVSGGDIDAWDAPSFIYSSTGDDQIHTGPGTHADTVESGANDDEIFTVGGDDTISGGDDADIINAGPGDDFVQGGDGDDTLIGGDGNDTMDGNGGIDYIQGLDGTDYLIGGTGDDTILGGTDDDEICGGDNTDDLSGGGDADCICGGDEGTSGNNDSYADTMIGNTGADTCYYYSPETTSNVSTCTATPDIDCDVCNCDGD